MTDLPRPKDLLLIKSLLKPVMKFCLRRSLKLQEIFEAAKMAMLEVAQEEEGRSKAPMSVSRLSIMTGIHRADVSRLRDNHSEKLPQQNTITRVIGQWRLDKKFTNTRGTPRVLECDSKTSEFSELVKSVSHDLNPYTVLFELERINAVERTNKGIKLIAKNMIIKEDVQQAFEHLSVDADDLIKSVEENIFDVSEIKNLHLRTEYDRISQRQLQKIKKWFLDEGSAFHERARNFLSQFDSDINPKIPRDTQHIRVAMTTFSRVEEQQRD